MSKYEIAVVLQKMLDAIPRSANDFYQSAAPGPPSVDNQWGASWFLASLLREAVSIRPVISSTYAQTLLSGTQVANSTVADEYVSINSLLTKGYIRSIMGSIQIPTAIYSECSRTWQEGRCLTVAEHATIRTLVDAIKESKTRYWLTYPVAEELRERHAKVFPQTPSLEALVSLAIFSHHKEADKQGFLLLFSADDSSFWTNLASRTSGFFWVHLCQDQSFETGNQRFEFWYERISLLRTWNTAPEHMDVASRKKLIDAALERLLVEQDVLGWQDEPKRLLFDDRRAISMGITTFETPTNWSEWSYVERHDWWNNISYQFSSQNIPDDCRVDLILITQMILAYDQDTGSWSNRFAKIRRLLEASEHLPILAHWVPDQLQWNNKGALAWLLLEPKCAGLALTLLATMPVSYVTGGDWIRTSVRDQKLRELFWTDAVELFIQTLQDCSDVKVAAHSITDVLLCLARFSSDFRPQPARGAQNTNILSIGLLSAIESATYQGIYHPAMELAPASFLYWVLPHVSAKLLAASIDPEREDNSDFPDAELLVFFRLLHSAQHIEPELARATQTADLAEKITDLYSSKLRRSLSWNGAKIYKNLVIACRFFHIKIAKNSNWVTLVGALHGLDKEDKLISPFNFKNAISDAFSEISSALNVEQRKEHHNIHDFESAWQERMRFHLCLLLYLHQSASEGTSFGSSSLLIKKIEEEIAELLIQHQSTNLSQGTVKLFDWSFSGLLEADVSWPLISDSARVVGTFKEPLRTEVLTRWLGQSDDIGILLAAAGDFLPRYGIDMIRDRVDQLELDNSLRGLITIHNIVDLTNHAVTANLDKIADKLIAWGDRAAKGHRHGMDWIKHVFRLRMIQAYQAKDQNRLVSMPIPNLAVTPSKELVNDFEQQRSFYLGLLKLDSAPNESIEIFEKLSGNDDDATSLKINLFAARIRAAATQGDIQARYKAVRIALAMWTEVETSLNSSVLELLRPQIAYNKLSAAILLEQEADVNNELSKTPSYLKYNIDFLRLLLQYFNERGKIGATLIDETKAYHKMESVAIPLEMQQLFNDYYKLNPILINPNAGTVDDIVIRPERFRAVFLEIQKLPAVSLAYVVENRSLAETLLIHHHEVAKTMLDRISSISTIKDENKYNDYFESLLQARLALLQWNVTGQPRGGVSGSGGTGAATSGVGERDWLVKDHRGSALAITEALRLDSLRKDYLNKHLQKVFQYEHTGLEQAYIVIYYEGREFADFCNKYKMHIGQTNLGDWTVIDKNMKAPSFISTATGNIPVYTVVYKNEPRRLVVYHLLLNMN